MAPRHVLELRVAHAHPELRAAQPLQQPAQRAASKVTSRTITKPPMPRAGRHVALYMELGVDLFTCERRVCAAGRRRCAAGPAPAAPRRGSAVEEDVERLAVELPGEAPNSRSSAAFAWRISPPRVVATPSGHLLERATHQREVERDRGARGLGFTFLGDQSCDQGSSRLQAPGSGPPGSRLQAQFTRGACRSYVSSGWPTPQGVREPEYASMPLAARYGQVRAQATFIEAAVVAAHGATARLGGFRASDVRFFFLLFTNWIEHDVLRPEQDLDLTQVRRVLGRLAEQGWPERASAARRRGGGRPRRRRAPPRRERAPKSRRRPARPPPGERHVLTAAGLLGLVESIIEPRGRRPLEESLFVACFAAIYRQAILEPGGRGAREAREAHLRAARSAAGAGTRRSARTRSSSPISRRGWTAGKTLAGEAGRARNEGPRPTPRSSHAREARALPAAPRADRSGADGPCSPRIAARSSSSKASPRAPSCSSRRMAERARAEGATRTLERTTRPRSERLRRLSRG